MKGKKILVTGATGFLGTRLCRTLEILGAEVRRFGRVSRAVHALDGIECVVHLAAQTEVGKAVRNPAETFESNVRDTWELLSVCQWIGTPRVIVASSDKVYGSSAGPCREDRPVVAGSPYETSKACEDLISQCFLKTYGMSIAITRCANLYGPGHRNWTTLIPGTIKSVLEVKSPVLRSNGQHKREFLFVDDAVDAYIALIGSSVTGAYNFGTGAPMRVLDVVTGICNMMSWKGGVEIQSTHQSSQCEIQDQSLDSQRANQDLGWRPKVPFEEGVARTVEWTKGELVV